MSGVSTFWTDELLEQLTRLWASGWSAATIARHFGNGVTRSAVCGMLARKGLTRGLREPKRRASRAKPHHSLPLLTEPAAPKPLPPPEPTTDTAVTTLDLERGQCKWPLNDGKPHWLHCGAQRVAWRQYCAFHVAKASGGGTRGERDAA